jgi:hypothetical protein
MLGGWALQADRTVFLSVSLVDDFFMIEIMRKRCSPDGFGMLRVIDGF